MASSFRRVILTGLTLCLLLFSAHAAWAAVDLGGSLITGGVIDPYNQITANESQHSADFFSDATWIWHATGARPQFYGWECATMLFNHRVGGSNKWIGGGAPSFVTLQFPEAFVLSHFTLTSGGDSFGAYRQPTDWTVWGSNDGTHWTEIYVNNSYPDTTPFTTNNQTLLFTAFSSDSLPAGFNQSQRDAVNSLGSIPNADYNLPAAYSWYKLSVAQTMPLYDGEGNLTGHGETQICEWELFGFSSASRDLMPTTRTAAGTTSMFPNSAFHMDAGNLTFSTVGSDGKVSAWGDAAGRNISFKQEESSKQPTLDTTRFEIDGETFPAVRFNEGSRQQQLMLDGTPYVGSVFIVNQVATFTAGLGGLIGMNGRDYGIRAGNPYWNAGDGNDFGIAPGKYLYDGSDTPKNITTPHLLTAVTGGDRHLTENIVMGIYFDGGGSDYRSFDGYVAEVLAFHDKLDATEQKIVHTYFSDKYGLDISGGRAYETGGFHGRQFFLANTTNWNITDAGAGGFGIATTFGEKPLPAGVTERSAFDLFYDSRQDLPQDTVIVVTASTDDRFGLAGESVPVMLDQSELLSLWDKLWYVNISNPSFGDVPLVMGFDANDFLGTVDPTTEWFLLYSDALGGPFQSLGSAFFDSGAILFGNLSLESLHTGYYTLGTRDAAETPEPASWMLALLFLPLAAMAARRRKRLSTQK